MLASYDLEYEKWESEAGEYRVLIGSSSDNITAVCSFTAKGKTIYNYNQNTLLDTIVKDERADRILRDYLKEQGADISILEEYIIFFPHVPLVKMLTVLLGDKYPGEAERERKFEIVYSRLGELDL